MKELLKFYGICFLMIGLMACSKSDDEPISPPEPDKEELTIPATESLSPVLGVEGGTASVSFTAAAAWTASVTNTRADGWVSVSPLSGSKGNSTITITTAPNTTPDERNATIVLKCGNATKNIVLTQKQKDALTVTTTKYEMPQEGGEIQVEVKANVSFSVVIPETSKEWIKELNTQSRALETNQLKFSVDINEETEKREGEIIFQGGELTETVHVYQAGGRIILLSKNEYPVSDQGGVIQVELKSNCDYEVRMPDVDWVKETTQTRALSTHTLYYEVGANAGYDNRTAEIVFKDKASSISDTLQIIQAQKNAIVISKKKYEVSSLGESIEVEYNANVDCLVEIPSDCKWITQVDNATRGLIPHKAYFKIEPNDTKEPRNGKILMHDKDSLMTETIEVVQEGLNYYLRLTRIDDNSTLACNYKGGEFGFDVESNGPYKFEILGDDTSWMHYIRKEDRGNNTFCEVVHVDENNTDTERKVKIRFSLGAVVHEFNFVVCEKRTLSFSQTEFNASADGGELPLEIKAGGDWALNKSEFYHFAILQDDASWVSVKRGTKPESKKDTATIVVQPNLTSQPRSTRLKFYVFSGEEYYIQVDQAAQGAVVVSQNKYILSSDAHTVAVELATSDYNVEIDDNAVSWIHLGEKIGDGKNTKQELIINQNTTTNERNGTITFSTGDAKNQITVTQLMAPPELVDDTPAKWKQFQLPKVILSFSNPASDGSQIYKAIVPDCEELVNIASRKVLDCLYMDPGDDVIPRQSELEYVLDDYDGVSYNVGNGRRIVLSNQYLARYYRTFGAEAMIKENIGILTHELTHSYEQTPKNCGEYQQGTVYHAFIEGIADAVRVLCGGFPNEDDRPNGGHYLDSYRFTGFFLAWLVKNKDENFLRKFNLSARDIDPWSFDAGIKYALGESYNVDDLWAEYLKAMGDIK